MWCDVDIFFLQSFRSREYHKSDSHSVSLSLNLRVPSPPLTHMQTHMQIYLTHRLSPKGFIHSVMLYPVLTHVHAVEEEKGTQRVKQRLGKHGGGQRRKETVKRREGEEGEMWYACCGLVMNAVKFRERERMAQLTDPERNERKDIISCL